MIKAYCLKFVSCISSIFEDNLNIMFKYPVCNSHVIALSSGTRRQDSIDFLTCMDAKFNYFGSGGMHCLHQAWHRL